MSPIRPEPYDIAAKDAVDLIGRSFNFSHPKGVVEWLKNSWDAYQRLDKARRVAPNAAIDLRGSGKSFREVAVVDFCGMRGSEIDDAFKKWFSVTAATRGRKRSEIYGGHGNGGKFYMRQMFQRSHITTWLDGTLHRFGFNEEKEYGYDTRYKDFSCEIEEALRIAQIDLNLIPPEPAELLAHGNAGFTVVRGFSARGRGAQVLIGTLLEALRKHAQMATLLDSMSVGVWVHGVSHLERLQPERPDRHPDFPLVEFDLPRVLSGSAGEFDYGASDPAGNLKIAVAVQPLTGRAKAFNRVDVSGGFGVVASYPLPELPLTNLRGAEWLMATLLCEGVEDPNASLVENDRERLVAGPKTDLLLAWIARKLDEQAGRVEEQSARERRETQAAETARLTADLNRYARQFLRDFYREALGGAGEGSAFGGTGGGDAPVHSKDTTRRASNERGRGGGEGDDGGGSGDRPGRTRTYPEVLVAGIDPDPFSEKGDTLELGPRYPTLYQRVPDDVGARIYWINTEAVYPRLLLDQFGETSPTWKNYILMRHRDVVVKEALRHLTETEGQEFSLEAVNNRWDELTDQFLNQLELTLADALFDSPR